MEKDTSNQQMHVDEQILRLVEKEWELFRRVQNKGGPADCQSDRRTFFIMRCSQFMAWSPEVRICYEQDLDAATAAGRNLLTEKYAHMMRYTFPEEYAALKDRLPKVPAEAENLIGQILKLVLNWAVDMERKYPWLMAVSRPIDSTQDARGTSIETYTRGELATYSVKTLAALLAYYTAKHEAGINLQEATVGISAQFYGYSSLEQANEIFRNKLRPRGKNDAQMKE